MAKKKAKAVQATLEEVGSKAVRLDLTATDHERLAKCAKERGLSMSSYARMAVLALMKQDENDRGRP